MKHLLHTLAVCSLALSATAQDDGAHFLYMSDGTLQVFPDSLVQRIDTVDEALCLHLANDSLLVLEPYEVDSLSRTAPALPQFTSFKFNNKFNDGLPADVVCTLADGRITGFAGGIGKYLTPSFKTDVECTVLVDGAEQESKVSRHNFAQPVDYTLSQPGWSIFTRTLPQAVDDDEEEQGGDDSRLRRIPLTADDLSTNAPSGRGEGLENAVDDNTATYFHSTWTGDPLYEKLPLDSCPYIDVNLPHPITSLMLSYVLRDSNRTPTGWNVYTANEGEEWRLAATIGKDELTELSVIDYHTTLMHFGESCTRLRLEMTSSNYKNYLVLAELRLYEEYKEEEGGDGNAPATPAYIYSMQPYGNHYRAAIDWRIDAGSVPRIDIDIENGATVTSKDYYLKALFTLSGNNAFEDVTDSVRIKGRGNSTWSGNKRPYRLKFASKTKLCGLKSGKNWVLLANAQDPTLMENAVAFKAGQMVGAAYTNHSIPVELYMNGRYYGSYTLSEKLGVSNNSVDEDDMTPFFELDTYYDEPYKFYSSSYSMPVMLHNPDFTETDVEWPEEIMVMFKKIKQDYNTMEAKVYEGDLSMINVDSLARFMLVNDLTLNLEIMHPKSTYLYKSLTTGQYIFGPLWDFDWGFGYELNNYYFNTVEYPVIHPQFGANGSYRFFYQLFTQEEVKKAYFRLWRTFASEHIDELIDYIDVYANFAESSFEHNAQNYYNSYAYSIGEMKRWLKRRCEYIYSNLTPYDDDPVIEEPQDTTDVAIDRLPMQSGLTVTLVNGALSIEADRAQLLPLYAVDGRQVAVLKLNEGHNLFVMLPRGVFVVNRKKIHVR